MRVVLAAESFLPRVNGVVNSVIHVARNLRDRGIPVMIIAPDTYGHDDFEGVPVARLRSIEVPTVHDVDVVFASSVRCARILSDFDATVVHLASPFVLGARIQSAARSLGIPTAAVFQTDIAGFASHYGLGPLTALADKVVRRIHASADINLVPSSPCAAYLARLGVHHSRIWGRGVDVEQFNPVHRSEALHRAWAPDRQFVVGFVGRLAPEKNVEVLARLHGRSDIRLVIVGDGPSRRQMERQLPEAQFTGRLVGSDLGAAMASFDVLVAPGENETFCQVVQEGMASAVAVVAPAIGGPLDLIQHGTNGLLYRPGDATSMAASVLALRFDEGLRQRLIREASRIVRTRSWSVLCDELVGHYTSISRRRSNLEAA